MMKRGNCATQKVFHSHLRLKSQGLGHFRRLLRSCGHNNVTNSYTHLWSREGRVTQEMLNFYENALL